MSEFEGTKENVVLGDEKYYNGNKAYEIWYGNDGECVAEVVHKIEDANLIVDAFKVRQQINCELSELLEMYKECFELFIPMDKWDEATEFLSTYGSGLAKNLKKITKN